MCGVPVPAVAAVSCTFVEIHLLCDGCAAAVLFHQSALSEALSHTLYVVALQLLLHLTRG